MYVSETGLRSVQMNVKLEQTLLRWKRKKTPNGSFASRGITTERTVRIANHPPIKGDISP